MRLKEDNSSWRSRGIVRRDFRHDAGLPETETGRTKVKKKKPRKRIDHKHIWVEHTRPYPYFAYWFETNPKEDPRPEQHVYFECTVFGCKAHKYKLNPRYGYDYWRWCKRNR